MPGITAMFVGPEVQPSNIKGGFRAGATLSSRILKTFYKENT